MQRSMILIAASCFLPKFPPNFNYFFGWEAVEHRVNSVSLAVRSAGLEDAV